MEGGRGGWREGGREGGSDQMSYGEKIRGTG